MNLYALNDFPLLKWSHRCSSIQSRPFFFLMANHSHILEFGIRNPLSNIKEALDIRPYFLSYIFPFLLKNLFYCIILMKKEEASKLNFLKGKIIISLCGSLENTYMLCLVIKQLIYIYVYIHYNAYNRPIIKSKRQ